MTKPILILILAMLSIQTGAGLAKSLFPIVGAAGTTTLRLVFATAVLWLVWRPWKFKFDRTVIKDLALYGGSLGLMNLTFYFALQRIPLGMAVTFEFVGPLVLAVLSSRKKMDVVWVVLAGAGIYLVMPHSSQDVLDPIGVAFALGAGFFWALYIFFGKRAGNALHGGLAATAGMTMAALVTLPFGLFLDGAKLLNPSILPLAFLVAILSSALPYTLEMMALKQMPAKTFSVLMSLEPVIATMVGLVLLGETLLSIQYLAISLIITASVGSVLSRDKS